MAEIEQGIVPPPTTSTRCDCFSAPPYSGGPLYPERDVRFNRLRLLLRPPYSGGSLYPERDVRFNTVQLPLRLAHSYSGGSLYPAPHAIFNPEQKPLCLNGFNDSNGI